jgi:hypothetical protein
LDDEDEDQAERRRSSSSSLDRDLLKQEILANHRPDPLEKRSGPSPSSHSSSLPPVNPLKLLEMLMTKATKGDKHYSAMSSNMAEKTIKPNLQTADTIRKISEGSAFYANDKMDQGESAPKPTPSTFNGSPTNGHINDIKFVRKANLTGVDGDGDGEPDYEYFYYYYYDYVDPADVAAAGGENAVEALPKPSFLVNNSTENNDDDDDSLTAKNGSKVLKKALKKRKRAQKTPEDRQGENDNEDDEEVEPLPVPLPLLDGDSGQAGAGESDQQPNGRKSSS